MMMSGAELRETLTALGLSQVNCAKLLEKNDRTIRRWVQDGISNDPVSAMLLHLLRTGKVTLEQVEAAKREVGFAD